MWSCCWGAVVGELLWKGCCKGAAVRELLLTICCGEAAIGEFLDEEKQGGMKRDEEGTRRQGVKK